MLLKVITPNNGTHLFESNHITYKTSTILANDMASEENFDYQSLGSFRGIAPDEEVEVAFFDMTGPKQRFATPTHKITAVYIMNNEGKTIDKPLLCLTMVDH
jgi:hypothetical protein